MNQTSYYLQIQWTKTPNLILRKSYKWKQIRCMIKQLLICETAEQSIHSEPNLFGFSHGNSL